MSEMKVKKDPSAVTLGRKGGKARAIKLTPEQRQKIARDAALARWKMYDEKPYKAT